MAILLCAPCCVVRTGEESQANYRIYSEEQLQVRTKRRKKLTRPRVPMAVLTKRDERRSIDFVSDQLANGRRFRVLNIVDDFTRECVGQLIETSIFGAADVQIPG